MKNKIIAIVGPTSSGKTDLSIKIANWLDKNVEIISADSRQVYKGMDIATGKIKKEEMMDIPHHLLDVASPKRKFTVSQYKEKALNKINEILKKKKTPIIIGGTGFYIQSIVDGIVIPKIKPDWNLRNKLEKETTENLFNRLKKKDPQRAKNIDGKNRRRLIRAIEIIIKSKKRIPALKNKKPNFNVLILGIKKDQKEINKLIKKRLKKRLKQGMIKEVKNLLKSGVSFKRMDELGLEYRYISKYIKKEINYNEMKSKIQKESEHYSKRQMTWFKKDKRIKWIKNYSQAKKEIEKFLK